MEQPGPWAPIDGASSTPSPPPSPSTWEPPRYGPGPFPPPTQLPPGAQQGWIAPTRVGDPPQRSRPWVVGGLAALLAVALIGLAAISVGTTTESTDTVFPIDESAPDAEVWYPGATTGGIDDLMLVRMLTRAGDRRIAWVMPDPNVIDGPRSLRNVEEPAIGTFWACGGLGVPFRYDASVFEHLEALGGDPTTIADNLVRRLNGAPVDVGTFFDGTDMVQIDYVERFDDRIYVSRAFAWDATVFVISVAVPATRPELVSAARDRLDLMDESLTIDSD